MGNFLKSDPKEYCSISGITDSISRDDINGIYIQNSKESYEGRPLYRLESNWNVRLCFKGGFWRIYGKDIDSDDMVLVSILSSANKFPDDHNDEEWSVNCAILEWKQQKLSVVRDVR